jgi:hypothetical protein
MNRVGGQTTNGKCTACNRTGHLISQCTAEPAKREAHTAARLASYRNKTPSKPSSSTLPPELGRYTLNEAAALLKQAEAAAKNNSSSTQNNSQPAPAPISPPQQSSAEECKISSTIQVTLSPSDPAFLSPLASLIFSSPDKSSSIEDISLEYEGSPEPSEGVGDCCARTSSKWSSVFGVGIGRASNSVQCLLDTGGLSSTSYMSQELLDSLPPGEYEELDIPNMQMKGVGANAQAILFTKAVRIPVFFDGILAKKPTEHRVLKKKIIMRITSRSYIHHDVVFNERDVSQSLGITMQLPKKTIWWHSNEATQKTKIIPAFFATVSATLAEKSL